MNPARVALRQSASPTWQCACFLALRLRSDREVDGDHGFGFLRNRKVYGKVARFRQINTDQPGLHRDALEFPDGDVVLLTRLCEGQHATVLQLPASHTSSAAEEPRSAPVTKELVRSAWSVRG